jgi:hypothetical protein
MLTFFNKYGSGGNTSPQVDKSNYQFIIPLLWEGKIQSNEVTVFPTNSPYTGSFPLNQANIIILFENRVIAPQYYTVTSSEIDLIGFFTNVENMQSPFGNIQGMKININF